MVGGAVEDDVAHELLEIVRELRAHVEWHGVSGTIGLPRDPGAKARVEAFWREHAAPPAFEEAPPAPSRDAPRRAPLEAVAAPSAAPSPAAPLDRKDSPARPVRAPRVSPAPSPAAVHLPKYGSLDELKEAVRSCTACALHEQRTQTVFARGTGSSRVCFVGEGPGAEEDAQGEPFVGAAGQLLDKMIAAMGLGRDEVYICNIVKCRPPNNRRPEPPEIAACSGYLRAQLEFLDPEVIIALGGTAVSGLLGLTEGITRLRGTFRLYQGRIPVMPTFHPAYLLRNPGAKREVWADLKAVLAHLGRVS
jgi:uracil-DNA glycosylase family 4